jgi:hypothetical protein
MSDEILNEVKDLNNKLGGETLREVIADMTSEEAEGRLTCDELFSKVEPYCKVPAIGNSKYEEIRKDYNDCSDIWNKLQVRMAALKENMSQIESEMNSQIGGIPQELFTQHYETVRDLSHSMGQEAALLLRKSASAVIFLSEITKLDGAVLN